MREIKFRAWDKKGKQMIDWQELSMDCDGFYALDEEGTEFRFDEVMQYTGLKDKNGLTDIYEDDIIDIEGRVIGNKYQNNDLLQNSSNLLVQGFGTSVWETTNKKAMERGCKYAE